MKSLAALLFASALLPGCAKSGSSDLDDRVKKLETDLNKYRAELEWIYPQYQQMKAKQDQQDAEEAANTPDPNTTFAVDVAPDLKLGQVEGPPTACVTLVEAWDFA